MAGGLWMAGDGLWAAATIGLYATAGCSVGSSARARRLTAVNDAAGTVMTYGARPGTGVPAASHPEAARRCDTPASRRDRPWAWVLAAVVGGRCDDPRPGAAGDGRAAFAHLGGLRLSWLGAAVAAQVVSLAGGVAAQRQGARIGAAAPPATAPARSPWTRCRDAHTETQQPAGHGASSG